MSKKNTGYQTSKYTILQVTGLCLIVLSILYLLITQLYFEITGEIIAIDFFVIMLGISFVFPDLLSGTTGLSTMRIVVFMMVNVICMLLLKIGWSAASLKSIGIDEYWMGIIAFVFGSKATQSYFESKMAIKQPVNINAYSKAQIAQIAIQQNQDQLKNRFKNIASISDAVKDLSGEETHTVAIYLKDNDTEGLPNSLTAKLADGTELIMATEIITSVGEGKIHIAQSTDFVSDISSPDFLGSICCLVKSVSDPDFYGAVTSGHIYSSGVFKNIGGVLDNNEQVKALISGIANYQWFFQVINNMQDLAIVRLNDKPQKEDHYQSFSQGYYEVADKDVCQQTANVTIISKGNNIRDAYIVDHNISVGVTYNNNDTKYISGIILIGDNTNRNLSSTLTKPGDSGSCVYHKGTKKLIGMILGGDNRFSYVLSISETLANYNFIPL